MLVFLAASAGEGSFRPTLGTVRFTVTTWPAAAAADPAGGAPVRAELWSFVGSARVELPHFVVAGHAETTAAETLRSSWVFIRTRKKRVAMDLRISSIYLFEDREAFDLIFQKRFFWA
jgi:hypothetical protein